MDRNYTRAAIISCIFFLPNDIWKRDELHHIPMGTGESPSQGSFQHLVEILLSKLVNICEVAGRLALLNIK